MTAEITHQPSVSLENLLVRQLAPQVAKEIDIEHLKNAESYVSDLVRRTNPTLEIKLNNNELKTKIECCHGMFETILKHIETNEPLFLTGPAGSGKSTIAEQAALALGYEFGAISVCAQTTKSDFLGYMDANGRYVSTMFRKIYETGGMFLIDEIDAGNPNVLAVLNAALSGSQFAFPDGLVKKNEKFILIATANTLGKGSAEYVGRNQLDLATLDRFNFIFVDYDKKLEKTLAPKKYHEHLRRIYKIREFINEKDMKIIVSTRSIIKIMKLLENGFQFRDCLSSTVFKHTNKETIEMILSRI